MKTNVARPNTGNLPGILKVTSQDLWHERHLLTFTCRAWMSNSWHAGWWGEQMCRLKWLCCEVSRVLGARQSRDFRGSCWERHRHTPLIPGRSMLACSWIPMPLRMIRREPSLNAPEHVTSWNPQRQTRTQSETQDNFLFRGCAGVTDVSTP